MRLTLLPVWAVVASSATLLGCGSSGGNGGTASPDSGVITGEDAGTNKLIDASTPPADTGAPPPATDSGVDAGPPPEVLADAGDYGGTSSTYPAFTVDAPRIVNNGEAVLATPVVVTVTWPGDTLADTFEAFGDNLGATTYWQAAVGEYGVGPVTSGAANHIRLTSAPPATMADTDVATFVTNNLTAAVAGTAAEDGGTPWPAPTSQTIYAIYLSSSTDLTSQGQSLCAQGVGGYHDSVQVGSNQYSYAVMPHCNDTTATPPVVFQASDIEESASHEFAEAATDPIPGLQTSSGQPANGYQGFDNDHWNYEFFNQFQDELGDACESFQSSYFQDTETNFPYWVQRMWSNKGVAAGHNPCSPVIAAPFYNTTVFTDQLQAVALDFSSLGGGTYNTKAFHALVGQSVTFQVGFFSDADTGGPWTVTSEMDTAIAQDPSNGNPIDNGTATVTLDQPTGENGHKAYVTVTPTKAGQLGVQLIVLRSALPGEASIEHPNHYLPILIANQ